MKTKKQFYYIMCMNILFFLLFAGALTGAGEVRVRGGRGTLGGAGGAGEEDDKGLGQGIPVPKEDDKGLSKWQLQEDIFSEKHIEVELNNLQLNPSLYIERLIRMLKIYPHTITDNYWDEFLKLYPKIYEDYYKNFNEKWRSYIYKENLRDVTPEMVFRILVMKDFYNEEVVSGKFERDRKEEIRLAAEEAKGTPAPKETGAGAEEEESSFHKKNHATFCSYVSASYGDYEIVETTNWKVQGPIWGVGSDLNVSNFSDVEPIIIQKGLSILQELGSPFNTKTLSSIEDKINISSGSFLFKSTRESGIYFKNEKNGLLSSGNDLVLRSKGNILLHAGQKILIDDSENKITATQYGQIQESKELLLENKIIDSDTSTMTQDMKAIKICGNMHITNKLFLEKTNQLSNDYLIYSAPKSNNKTFISPAGYKFTNIYISPEGYRSTNRSSALRFRLKKDLNSAFIVEYIVDQDIGSPKRADGKTRSQRNLLLAINSYNGNMVIGSPDHSVDLHVPKIILKIDASNGSPKRGMILPFRLSSENSVPSGWVVCDGSNNTPNLSGCFVKGGSHTVKASNVTITNTNTKHAHEIPIIKGTFKFKVGHERGPWGETYATNTGAPAASGLISASKVKGSQKYFYCKASVSQADSARVVMYTPLILPKKTHIHSFPATTVLLPNIEEAISQSIVFEKATTITTETNPPFFDGMVYIMKTEDEESLFMPF